MSNYKLGIIGGSGLYQMLDLEPIHKHDFQTPYGSTSDSIHEFEINNTAIYFLARHGNYHQLLPSEVNYQANIFALKKLGVTHLLSVSAVGSLREEQAPGHMVIPDQILDFTSKKRPSTFFGDGLVGHISMAKPFCDELSSFIYEQLKKTLPSEKECHQSGTYLCIEGPQFSTIAESNFYRKSTDANIIGMTAIPEAKLAREAQMAYATLALVTDYDCWHSSSAHVETGDVLAVLKQNSTNAQKVVRKIIENFHLAKKCSCHEAAKNAWITKMEYVPKETSQRIKNLGIDLS